MVHGDEAVYATVVDNMLESGDWMTPCYIQGRPFHDKPPLYFWLTAWTYPLFGDGANPLPYRFWAAVFAIGSVLVTFLLGRTLVSDTIGVVAGAALLLNTRFLLTLGARYGNLDTTVTFFIALGILFYLWQMRGWRPLLAWGLTGAALGAACMAKPPVVGGCFLVLLTAHHLVVRRELSPARRLAGPVIAASACFLVAAPWHFYQWWLWGNDFLQLYFFRYVFHRALQGFAEHANGPWFYWTDIMQSSTLFHAVWPATALAVLACWRTPRRREWSLLLALSLGFVGIMSLSASKLFRYVYPAYPLLSVAVAAVALDWIPIALQRLCKRPGIPWRAVLGIAVGAALLQDARIVRGYLRYSFLAHSPWVVYESALPALQDGSGRFVLFQFPHPDQFPHSDSSGLRHHDLFYTRHMPWAENLASVEEVRHALDDGKPSLVLLPPLVNPDEFLAQLGGSFISERHRLKAYPTPYTLLSFHDGLARLDVSAILERVHVAED